MSTEIWIALIGSSTTIMGSIVSWLLAKKKYYAEAENNIIQNMENSLEFYKKLSDDNRARLEEMAERNTALEIEVQELRKQMLNLTLNICMDLTCANRVREQIKRKNSNGKNKDRFDETENLSSGGSKSLGKE